MTRFSLLLQKMLKKSVIIYLTSKEMYNLQIGLLYQWVDNDMKGITGVYGTCV